MTLKQFFAYPGKSSLRLCVPGYFYDVSDMALDDDLVVATMSDCPYRKIAIPLANISAIEFRDETAFKKEMQRISDDAEDKRRQDKVDLSIGAVTDKE